MKARRKKAADGCFCTHESNSYYPSLPFNPKHLIQIKKLEREMKKARKQDRRASEETARRSEPSRRESNVKHGTETRSDPASRKS